MTLPWYQEPSNSLPELLYYSPSVDPSSLTIRARAEPLTACRPGPGPEDIRPTDGADPTAGLVQKLFLDYRLRDEFSLDRGAPQSLEQGLRAMARP